MSEKLLKALMQLFAIIARPESNRLDRRTVVESFLKRELNEDIVKEYLGVFDHYYKLHQEEEQEEGKRRRKISSQSVRVLKIGTEINEELTQQQKIIVLIQLLEFVKSDGEEISDQEMEFIDTVSDIFYISSEEYHRIKEFVLYPFDKLPNSTKVLLVDNNKEFIHPKTKHLYSDGLEGQIRIFNVETANMFLTRYIGESEMYLNSQLVQQDKVYVLTTGSSIRNPQIRPIYYSDIVSRFYMDRIKERTVFEVDKVSYRFKNGKYGLHKVSFAEESGRLIGIMGASGAGKSTLLNVLNGSEPPSEGSVKINNFDIHRETEKIEGIIGHVSQDDLLIEELTVYQNLYYNAKLCFDNYTEDQVVETVNKVLQNLGLFEIKDIQVGSPLNKKISGGQRKRLNIALELIREPSVLFLDEPTSGLSSRDSENIMDLLKELALKGKLVFVVIHQPSSDIFKMFDRLLILDTGGFLIYNGDPIDSIIYFKSRMHHANWNESECHCCGNVNPEQIFNIVEANVIDEYGKLTHTRKITPREWSKYYAEYQNKHEKKFEVPSNLPEINFKIPNKIKQFLVFVKRDVLSKLSNTQYLVINFLEAPLLAMILAYIIKFYNVNVTNEFGYTLSGNSNLPVYIFMSVIVAIFVGLTVSAEEIIKDRKILKREAFLHLSWASYLFSKVAVLFVLSAIQALTFVLIGNTIMEIRGMYWQYWLVLFSAWASANIMGLVISDSFKTVVTIYILIPFLVIPQIILSGIIVKFEKLNPNISSPSHIPFYGELITARWAYEALAVYQFMNNKYQKELYYFEKAMSIGEFKKNYWLADLKNKSAYIKRNLDKPNLREDVIEDLMVLRNELSLEIQNNPIVPFEYKDSLYIDKLSPKVLSGVDNYLSTLNRYYLQLYNEYNQKRDQKVSALQKTPDDKEKFLRMKRAHHNESLTEFVTNSNEMERIIEFKGRLYQKIDPIYLDPEYKFIKSHFYSPRKMVFGSYVNTFWVNIGVIWFMTLTLFIILYFRLLRKALDFSEELSMKFKNSEK